MSVDNRASSAYANQKLVSHAPSDAAPMDSQGIGDISVDPATIQACFTRFYRFYAPIFPILDVELTPLQSLHECPLKFWVITTIGSRKYLDNSTLFSKLSGPVETLAMSETLAMTPQSFGKAAPYPILEAYLLMCHFHLSVDVPFWRTAYCTLSSAVVVLAQQVCMRTSLSSQGVFMTTGSLDADRGAKLSACANVSNQSLMALHGYPTNESVELRCLLRDHNTHDSLPDWLLLQARTMEVVAKVQRMITELAPTTSLQEQSRVLRTLISASDMEVSEIFTQMRDADLGKMFYTNPIVRR